MSPDDLAPVTQWTLDLEDPAKREDAARNLWDTYHAELEVRLARRIADRFQP